MIKYIITWVLFVPVAKDCGCDCEMNCFEWIYKGRAEAELYNKQAALMVFEELKRMDTIYFREMKVEIDSVKTR